MKNLKRNKEKDILESAEDDSGYFAEISDFYNAVKKGIKIQSTFDEGFKDLNVILNALRSAETGKRIS